MPEWPNGLDSKRKPSLGHIKKPSGLVPSQVRILSPATQENSLTINIKKILNQTKINTPNKLPIKETKSLLNIPDK